VLEVKMMSKRRAITTEDLLRMRWVSEPQFRVGNDGITCVVTSIQNEAWDYQSHIMEACNSHLIPITGGHWLDRSPRWSPDGSQLAFVSNRSGNAQLWVCGASGELTRLTEMPHGMTGAPQWTPDGSGLVFNAPEVLEGPVGRPGEPPPTVRVIRTLDYRADPTGVAHGARGHTHGFREGRRQQVWWVSRGGGVRQLTHGDFEHLRPRVSPDGRWVAFIANRTPDADRTTVQYLWVVRIDGGTLRQVGGGWGPITEVAWSPDGTRLAFVGHLLGDAGQDRTMPGLFAVDVRGGGPVNLLEGFEPTIGVWARGDFRVGDTLPGLAWDQRGIHFIASWHGAAGLYCVGDEGHPVLQVLGGDRSIFAFTLGSGGRVAFVAETAVRPGELHLFDPAQGERRITDANAAVLTGVELSCPEHFTFPGLRGQQVDAWIMPPVHRQAGRRYPLVLETHRGAYGQGFFFHLQVLTGAGYAVAYCNHVGAQGYGQDYALGQHGDWGGVDVQEMLRCLDAIEAGFEFVDGTRIGTQGLSAGGYYTNWLLGETDRFKAGVSEAGMWNWTSMFGTSDIGFPYVTSEMDGMPWDAFERYWRQSPASRAHRIQAPLLIIHADEDYRCPISEGEQLFQALRYQGKPVEFLWFVGETHGFSRIGRPVNRVERLRRILAWFDRYLRGGGLEPRAESHAPFLQPRHDSGINGSPP
jgi:acylaminoacyl-peptidase